MSRILCIALAVMVVCLVEVSSSSLYGPEVIEEAPPPPIDLFDPLVPLLLKKDNSGSEEDQSGSSTSESDSESVESEECIEGEVDPEPTTPKPTTTTTTTPEPTTPKPTTTTTTTEPTTADTYF